MQNLAPEVQATAESKAGTAFLAQMPVSGKTVQLKLLIVNRACSH